MQSSPGPTNDRGAWSAALPPPRDDEPPGLRRDILDEIADHLACAYNRELLRGVSSTEAWERVRERFGDPAAVARRLWFEAMKGKIMAQKIVVATCAVVALASLALVGIVYQRAVLVQRETLRATRAAERRAADAQALQQEMLKQLQAMSKAIEHPRSPDWNPVKIKVVEGSENGAPLSNISVTLNSSREKNLSISRNTDASGVADFGTLKAGYYSCTIRCMCSSGNIYATKELTVAPGSDVNLVIVAPGPPADLATVRVRCDWPAGLEKAGLALIARFEMRPVELSGLVWTYSHAVMSGWPRPKVVAISSSRAVLYGPGTALAELSFADLNRNFGGFGNEPNVYIPEKDIHAVIAPDDQLSWECGYYELKGLYAVAPFKRNGARDGGKMFQTLAEAHAPGQMRSGLGLSREYWDQLADGFEIRPGQVNEWTIPLPDEVVDKVREELKKRPSAEE